MEIESKKRQLEETLSEPDPKKTRLDSEKSSPQLKKRTLKIIPPKEPTEKVGIAEVTEPRSTPTSPIKRQSSPSKSPKRAKSEESRPRSPQKSPQKSPVKKTEKELKLEEAKKTFEFQTVAKTLKKMQLLRDSEKVLDEIVEKRTEKVTESVIVNDSRLFDIKHPNNDLYLGHVVYTGAQSRAAHSNRAVDLELFLCPVFTEKNYYATIQVRIPAEFLTYRGNIAVRKSALWGTDIYTDDSDVVAMIIHSGHYRPVDAPDPLPQNPDVPSVNQAALVDSKQNATRTSSSISFLSEIATKVQPVIAQADLVNSSANVLTPDHDLHVTLRILPRLIKYTGSTRYGLDSKGWGASHDGESVRVEKVEKVERGSVRKSVKKGFSKKWFESAQGLKEVDRSFSFSLDGTASFKYTPKALISWPSYLKNQIAHLDPDAPPSSPVKADIKVEYLTSDLEAMKDLPYWRVQFSKYSLVIESLNGSKLFIKHSENTGLRIIDESDSVIHRDLKPEWFDWVETGLKIHSRDIDIPVQRYYWVK